MSHFVCVRGEQGRIFRLCTRAVLAMNLATMGLTVAAMSNSFATEFEGPPAEYFSCGISCAACIAITAVGCPIPACGNV